MKRILQNLARTVRTLIGLQAQKSKYSKAVRGIYAYVAMIGCLPFLAGDLGAQSGTAFRDFNGDGIQSGAEIGVRGVLVRLYINAALPAKDQLIGTTVTDANGNFNFVVSLTSGRAANPGELVRIEFEIPNSFECSLASAVDFEGLAGGVFGTSVQFITGQQSNIKFAINDPGQWVQNTNPTVFLPCYGFGNPELSRLCGVKGLVRFH